MKTTTHKIYGIALSLIFILSIITSCTKAKDTIGIIKVQYPNGSAMEEAIVILDQTNGAPGTDPIKDLRQEKTTDASGRAEFIYTYEAILDVSVTKEEGNDIYIGSSVIKLIRGETTTEVVETVLQ